MEEKSSIKKRALEFGSGLWVDMTMKMLEMEKSVKQQVQIKREKKMNKLMRAVSLAVFVLGLGYSAVSYAAGDEFMSCQNHAACASLYEKKAAEQDSLINQHERMVDSDFIRKNPSATAQNEMRQHCRAIAEKAKALKDELQSTAEWHKKQ